VIDASGYEVWYNASAQPFQPDWLQVCMGLFLVINFATVGFWGKSRFWSVLGPLIAAVLLIGGLWTIWDDGRQHRHLQSALRTGEFVIAEGRVEDFRRGRPDCREVSFRVDGHNFRFLSCEGVSGFNGAGMRDLTGECVKAALVHVPRLNADRVAWFGVRQCP